MTISLDRDGDIQFQVGGQVDATHSSLAQDPLDAIPSQEYVA